MISIEVLLVAMALGGAPGGLPSLPSSPSAPPPNLDAAAPIERRAPRRGAFFIKGRVVSRGAPVAYASLWVPADRLGVMADENGSFTITRVPAGACTLQVMGLGHYRRCLATVVAEPGLDSLVVALDPVSSPAPSCNPWFEVDPNQGDAWNVRGACANAWVGSATLSRRWGSLSIANACELSIRWTGRERDAARVTVRDSKGAVIRTLVDPDPSRPASHDGTVTWDGTRDDGSAAAAGEYRVRVEDGKKRLELAASLRRYGP